MDTTKVGREAEELVAQYLRSQGHKIIELNWRTRWCEIDIVSTHKKAVYFTEVKYRSSDNWGGGLEYIGKKKLAQMKFAAEFWIAEDKWTKEAQLQAAEVSSDEKIYLVEIS